jgi:S-DNA-T family DNA segregation ATPase FtsK/SpoIIIE
MTLTNARPIRVFLCHASNDKPSVRRLYNKLAEDKIDVWFDDEKLLPGQDWDVEIQKAVRISDVVIICLSNKSVTKEGYVQKEIKIALDVADEKPEGTIFIIPVRLEECNVPDRLKRWQWIDLFSQITDVDNNKLKKLTRSLELRAGQLNVKLRSPGYGNGIFKPNDFVFAPHRAWIYPPFGSILNTTSASPPNTDEIEILGESIVRSLESLNLPTKIIEVNWGPRIIRFGIEPMYRQVNEEWMKVSFSEISSAIDDLAMLLGARDIQVEPVSNRSYIGVDIPHNEPFEVKLRDILVSGTYQRSQKPLTVILGRDLFGEPVFTELSTFPNILLGGSTNSGKSTCLSSIVSSLTINNSPDEIKLLFIDMRRVEFSAFFELPHLMSPVVVDEATAMAAFDWLLREVEERKMLFAKDHFRNIDEYNSYADFEEKLPSIVVFISELSDLTTTLSTKVQTAIASLAGLARVTGIHLVVCTQRLSTDVVTEIIKSNFSNRVALKMLSSTDSINLINYPGAEKLLGRGDMLFLRAGMIKPSRIQGVSVSDDEIMRLVEFWRSQVG